MQPDKVSTTISYDDLGPAGIRGELFVLDVFENEARRDEDRLHDTSMRKFKLAGRLGKSETATKDIKFGFDVDDGDSFLLTPETTRLSRVRCPDGVFELRKNSRGEHSLVEFECEAGSIADARKKFMLAVVPFLDLLTFNVNSPLFLTSISIEDSKNNIRALDYVSPYRPATLSPHFGSLFPELMPVFALYREAKNSGSSFYKFLCYHKLLDGIYGIMRANLFKQAKSKNITLTQQRDVVPDSPYIVESLKQHIGQSIKVFLDSTLTPRYRNAVAHFVTDDGGILNMSLPEHINSYAEILYITELAVRVAIESYQSMLTELYSKG